MRLFQYINESSVIREIEYFDEFNELVHKNCKQYLKLIRGKDHPLYRGMYWINSTLGEKAVRQDRVAKGMGSYQAAVLNKWLQENGHVRRDKAVIATSSSAVRVHGERYFIFPVGKFEYTYVESKDINVDDKRTGWYIGAIEDVIEYGFDDMKDYKRLPKEFSEYFHTNKGFDKAYKNQFEIWMNSKSYYFANELKTEWDKIDKKIMPGNRIN